MTTVERVARAMWDLHCVDSGDIAWDDAEPLAQGNFRMMARAAIVEMREPTYQMIVAAMITPSPTVAEAGGILPQAQQHTRLEWQAMIDAALAD